jgi:hypothetical protein
VRSPRREAHVAKIAGIRSECRTPRREHRSTVSAGQPLPGRRRRAVGRMEVVAPDARHHPGRAVSAAGEIGTERSPGRRRDAGPAARRTEASSSARAPQALAVNAMESDKARSVDSTGPVHSGYCLAARPTVCSRRCYAATKSEH